MRVAVLRALLLTSAALLASVTAVGAQGGGYPGGAPFEGGGRIGQATGQVCSGYSTVACGYMNPDATVAGCASARRGSIAGCGDPPAGYHGCVSPYAPYTSLPYGSRTQDWHHSSSGSSFFAAGGEAYSYAGYGAFSPLGYGAGTSSPHAAYGTSAFSACVSTESGPVVLPAGGSTTAGQLRHMLNDR